MVIRRGRNMALRSDGASNRCTTRTFVSGTIIKDYNGPWTFAWWFATGDTSQASKYLFYFGPSTGGNTQVAIIYGYATDARGHAQFEFYDPGSVVAGGDEMRTGSQITVPGRNWAWNHFAYSYGGDPDAGYSGEWAYWVNGRKTVIYASRNRGFSGSGNSQLNVFQSRVNNSRVNGAVRDLVYDNRVYGELEMRKLASGFTNPARLNPWVYYPLDEVLLIAPGGTIYETKRPLGRQSALYDSTQVLSGEKLLYAQGPPQLARGYGEDRIVDLRTPDPGEYIGGVVYI